MYILKTPLTEQQYNELINSSNIKDTISNYFAEQEQTMQSITTSMSVGILSTNNFNKYIKTSTLGGSIQPNDTNVWHCITTSDYACVLIMTNNDYSSTQIQNIKNNIGISNLETFIYKVTQGRWYSQQRSKTITCCYELSQNNASNNHSVINTILPRFCTARVGASTDQTGNVLAKEYITITSATKSMTYNSISKTAQDRQSDYTNKMILTVNYSINFRPVFRFKDNKKSENIFR